MAIHALSSYHVVNGDKLEKHYIRKVLVSDLHFLNANKIEIIDRVTSVGNF